MSIWNELGIAPTPDRRAIKLAYAARLEQVNLEQDAAAFQRLIQAYEEALCMAASGREPLPPLALDQPLATPLALNLSLETDAELAQQGKRPWAPGTRPHTASFTRRTPPPEAIAESVETPLSTDQMQRAKARAWRDQLLALPPANPVRLAFGVLNGKVQPLAYEEYAKYAYKLDAMRALLKRMSEEAPEALQHEVNPEARDWWLAYLNKDDKLRDTEERVARLMQMERIPGAGMHDVPGIPHWEQKESSPKRGGRVVFAAFVVLVVVWMAWSTTH